MFCPLLESDGKGNYKSRLQTCTVVYHSLTFHTKIEWQNKDQIQKNYSDSAFEKKKSVFC